jgi:hypothetical protein
MSNVEGSVGSVRNPTSMKVKGSGSRVKAERQLQDTQSGITPPFALYSRLVRARQSRGHEFVSRSKRLFMGRLTAAAGLI